MTPFRAAALAAVLAFAAAPGHADCAAVSGPCNTSSGTYHIALPDQTDAPTPAILWLHGFGGSGQGAMRNTGMVNTVLARGYAFIAADALRRTPDGPTAWGFRPDDANRLRNEPAFFAEILADAADRHGIDPDRVILAGFSIGGSMTSYTACQHPDQFAAFAPVAGGFWRPHPTECAGPVRLFHTHGWRDMTVPLEGRPLRGGALKQGDIFRTLEIWRDTNGCEMMRPDEFDEDDTFWVRRWTFCSVGSSLEFALHRGAHGIPKGWAARTLDWYEGLDR